ncbi:MAG: YfcC family protein [Bacteroidetes bacterium]|nr:MAG: YfcC family protein [Bacteroidota bacterium]
MAKKLKFPHTYVIIFYTIVIAAILSWMIPGGEYVEVLSMQDGKETTELVYQSIESQPQTWEVFAALFEGFERQSGIIVFIFMIGGAFWILNESKSIDVGIFSFLGFTRKLEKIRFIRKIGVDNIVMTMIMLMFSIFGAVFGMSEETIAFIIILVPLSISMGYDSITGVGLVFVSAGLGFAGAILNPFTIGIAQGIAELPLFSGLEYRLFCWAVINFIGIFYILRWANKVKRNPRASYVYDDDEYWRKSHEAGSEKVKYHTPLSAWITYGLTLIAMGIFAWKYPYSPMRVGDYPPLELMMVPAGVILFAITGFLTLRKSVHFFILNLLSFTIYFLIVGVMGYAWYIMEIATLFFAMGILSGIAMNYSPNRITKLFIEGMKDILSAAVIVGLAGGIIVILEDGKIISTILYSLSKGMQDVGEITSIGIMYIIQNIINILIPSGSAKAAITMPIMAPFSDLIGLSRQATVMAFQFGDGFTNMITPTSGVLMGVLGVARIPYNKWVKWVAPLIIIMLILGFLLLIPTVTMDLPGFELDLHLRD